MAGENGLVEFPASPQQLEEALDRIFRGKINVARQAEALGMPVERLKQLTTDYILARPMDKF